MASRITKSALQALREITAEIQEINRRGGPFIVTIDYREAAKQAAFNLDPERRMLQRAQKEMIPHLRRIRQLYE